MKYYFLWNFPEANSFYAEGIQKLYSLNIVYCIVILTLVLYLMVFICLYFNYWSPRYPLYTIKDNWLIESIFILFPFMIVLLLIYPSFSLLYSLNEIHETEATLKIIGHQWYWSYEYTGNIWFLL
jgi:heme/copper-type cytochrome/quinol oxidase subunit 2